MPYDSSSSHRTLNNKTPNDVFDDYDYQMTRHLNYSAHNHFIYQSVPFEDGQKVEY